MYLTGSLIKDLENTNLWTLPSSQGNLQVFLIPGSSSHSSFL